MRKLLLFGLLTFTLAASAQEKDKNLPAGNASFADKKYADAEAEYRISQSNKRKNAIASYNLGNSIYRQNSVAESKASFKKAIASTDNRTQKYSAFHNLGNAFMKEKDYSQAVEAYKNALRNNPEDDQTRYNFALAKKMLKENPPKKDKKEDKKDKKDDKNKDKDKNKNDKNKDKKDDKKDGDKDKDKGKNDQPQGQPKPKPGGISKERIQNLMDAVNNEEKKVQDKVNAKKVKTQPAKTEKDW